MRTYRLRLRQVGILVSKKKAGDVVKHIEENAGSQNHMERRA